jgi:hypothetical protein
MVSLVALFVTLLVILFVLLFVFIWLRIEVTRLSSAEAIAGVVVQLGKAKDEILARIAGLEAAAAAGEDLSGPLAELAAAAQALDDVVPDAVVEAAVDAPVEAAVVEGEQV